MNKNRYIIEEENEAIYEYAEDYGVDAIISSFMDDYDDYITRGGVLGSQISDEFKEDWGVLIDPEQLKNAYLEKMNKHFLYTYAKRVYQWFGIIMRNAFKLESNTQIFGHLSYIDFDAGNFVNRYNEIVRKHSIEYKKYLEKKDADKRIKNMFQDDEAYNDLNNGYYPKNSATFGTDNEDNNETNNTEFDGADETWIVNEDIDSPSDDIVFFDGKTINCSDFLCYLIGDWAEAPDGSQAISDYGLEPLFEIINEYDSNMPPESVLSLINRALDITHVRGDMASMFIYGGKESLRKITMESFIRGRGRYIINEAIKNDFDVNYFVSCKSYSARKRYCEEYIGKSIGKGSGRAVFQINDNAVLKLALNDKGVAQNEQEASNDFDDWFFPKIYMESEDDTFIISEFAVPINSKLFFELTGIEWNTYLEVLTAIHNSTRDRNEYSEMCMLTDDEVCDIIDNNEFCKEIEQYVGNYDIPTGDLTRIGHYGMVNRNGKPNIVLIDYGLNRDIYYQFYRKK
jgi:hypothetical protein